LQEIEQAPSQQHLSEHHKEHIGREIVAASSGQPAIKQQPLNPISSTTFNQQPRAMRQKHIKRKRKKGKNKQKICNL
jgi:hypothetical protein